MSKKLNAIALVFLNLLAFPAHAGPFDAWAHRAQIRFPGYTRGESLTNFPALIVLGTNVTGFRYQDSYVVGGADLRFATSNGTDQLDYEIEQWNTNGTSHIWVRLPLLNSNSVIWAYWGKEGVVAPASVTNGAVWSTAFDVVEHLAGGGASNVAPDATANRRTAVILQGGSSWTADGAIGPALQFTSDQNGLDLGATNRVDLGAAHTVSAWFKNLRSADFIPTLTTDSSDNDSIAAVIGTHALGTYNASTFVSSGALLNPAAGVWHHLSAVAAGGVTRYYIDGIDVGTAAFASSSDVRWIATYTPPSWAQWSEYLDEFRIENLARSSNWVWATHVNQADPANFQRMLGAPLVENVAPTGVTSTAAWANGSLVTAGADGLSVSLLWGTIDADAVTNGWWAHTNAVVALGAGPLTSYLPGLGSNTVYYSTYFATNLAGESWAAPSIRFKTRGIPGVDNAGGATAVAFHAATLNGTLTNGVSARVLVHFGQTDGNWSVTNDLGVRAEGAFALGVNGLNPGTTYYYRAYASNEYGAVWSPVSSMFTTPALGSYYVAATGSSAPHDGSSWAFAFTNLQDALDLGSGSTIFMKGEEFGINGQIVWTNSGISVLGGYAGGGSPGAMGTAATTIRRISGNTRVLRLNGIYNGWLQGVTIAGGALAIDGDAGAGLFITQCTNVFIADCVISNNAISPNVATPLGIRGAGIYAANSTVTLSNCVVRGNTLSYTALDGRYSIFAGAGVYVEGGEMTVRDSAIDGNRIIGAFWGWQRGGGLCLNTGTLKVRNCTVAGNDVTSGDPPTDYGDALDLYSGNASFEHCTIAANGGIGLQNEFGTLTVTNSILWANGDDITGAATLGFSNIQNGDSAGTNGCISTAPQFERGLYLATNSPCVDAGSGLASTLGMSAKTTRADGAGDVGTADMGYHHELGIDPELADLYVSVAGSDATGSGSVGAPFRSITKALSVSQEGTRVHIGAGSYGVEVETFPLQIARHGIQLLGSAASTTRISAAGAGVRGVNVLSSAGDTCIAGLAIANANIGAQYVYGGGLYVFASQIQLADLAVTNNVTHFDYNYTDHRGAGIYAEFSDVMITNCLVAKNQIALAYFATSYGGGLYMYNCRSQVRDSRFDLNVINGAGGTDRGAGMFIVGGTHKIMNCVWSGNDSQTSNMGDGLDVYAGDVSIANGTFFANNGEGLRRDGGTVAVTNSILWGNGDDINGPVALTFCDIEDGDSLGVNGCIQSDPLFEAGIYLGNGSPCIDGGVGTAVSWNLDGYTTRLNGDLDLGTVDMGYHFDPNANTAPTDLWVAGAGHDDTGNGTMGNPFRSITKALSLAGVGTKVHIGIGQYTTSVETFPLTLGAPGIQLLGTNAAQTIVSAAGSSTRVLFVSGVTGVRIENLSLMNGYVWGDPAQGGGVYLNNAGVVLAGCTIAYNKVGYDARYAVADGAGIFANASSLIISNCNVRGNAIIADGFCNPHGAGVCVLGGSAAMLLNSTVEANTITTDGDSTDRGAGVYINGGAHTIFNCAIHNNDSVLSSMGDGLCVAAADVRVVSTTFYGNNGEGLRNESGTVAATNSILWANGNDIMGPVSLAFCDVEDGDNAGVNGCFAGDPRFEGGIYLGVGSPCIDAGTGTAAVWGLNTKSTLLSGALDSDIVDLGYHPDPTAGVGLPDLYVAGAGSDVTGDGTEINPWRSITKALSQAGVATRVHVAVGLYTSGIETFPLTIIQPHLQLLGTNATETVVDAQGSFSRVLTIDSVSGVRVENLTLQNGNIHSATARGGGVRLINSGATLAGCVVASNTVTWGARYGQLYGGGISAEGGSLVLEDCTVRDSFAGYMGPDWDYPGNAGYGGGVSISGASVIMRRCAILRNRAWGFEACNGGGLYVATLAAQLQNVLVAQNDVASGGNLPRGDGVHRVGGAIELTNVTIADNGQFGGVGLWCSDGPATIRNAIFWHNGVDISAPGNATVVCEWSDVVAVNGNVSQANCIVADPLFVDSDNADYHEKSLYGSWHDGLWLLDDATSPCIDAGDPGSTFYQEPASGSRINLGAYGNGPQASKSPAITGIILIVR